MLGVDNVWKIVPAVVRIFLWSVFARSLGVESFVDNWAIGASFTSIIKLFWLSFDVDVASNPRSLGFCVFHFVEIFVDIPLPHPHCY